MTRSNITKLENEIKVTRVLMKATKIIQITQRQRACLILRKAPKLRRLCQDKRRERPLRQTWPTSTTIL